MVSKKIRKKLLGATLAMIASLLIQPLTMAYDKDFYNYNDIRFFDPSLCSIEGAGTKVRGDGNIAKMWNWLIDKGLSNEQAAGILGNIQQESGFSPFRQEGAATWPKGGYGIVQWTASRRTEIVNRMKENLGSNFDTYYSPQYGGATSEKNGYVPEGVPMEVNDQFLTFELDYLYEESTTRKVRKGYGSGTEWEAIKASKTVRQASDVWLHSFERPADQSESHAAKRAEFGQKILEAMLEQASTDVDTEPQSPTEASKEVGATTYGGQFSDGKWSPNNAIQGGGNDDNGMGADGIPLPGKVAYAELSLDPAKKDFKALGGLPMYEKLAITYKDRTVIAEKRDVGAGAKNLIDGKPKALDLWWETARMLDFKDGSDVVTITKVKPGTPVTPFSEEPIKPGAYQASGDTCGNSAGVNGDLQATTLQYAWPEFKGKGYTTRKKEYADAISTAASKGMYLGGCNGVDCGAFVTRLLIDSGFDTGYNHSGKGGPTGTQEAWAKKNWESLGNNIDAANLKPGDVAFSPGHTFIFVGDIPGFGAKIASASLCSRAPMAGWEKITASNTRWYRKR